MDSSAAHIGSDKRKATGAEDILRIRLVLRAGGLGRSPRPKSTACAAGMLFYENARGTEVDQHRVPITNRQIQQDNITQSGEEAMIKSKVASFFAVHFFYTVFGVLFCKRTTPA
jgi:hypothetical protein